MDNINNIKTSKTLTKINNNLLDSLIQKQRELGLSDSKMAKTLNCSRTLWLLYRNHPERFPQFPLLRGIVANHPELCIVLLEHLRGNGNE